MTGHPRGDDTSVTADDGTESIIKRFCNVLAEVGDPANHRLDFHIDKFTNQDDFLQRGCMWVAEQSQPHNKMDALWYQAKKKLLANRAALCKSVRKTI
jgi:hypothetical protein